MSIHPDALKHFNDQAQNLVSKVSELPTESRKPDKNDSNLSSSHKDSPIIDLSKLGAIPKNLIVHDSDSGKLYEIYVFQEGKFMGLRDKSIESFYKLTKSLQKKLDWISYNKLQDLLIDWVVSTHFGSIQTTFIAYLEEWKKSNIRAINFQFLIPNLVIEQPFLVGDSLVTFNTSESIEQYLVNSETKPAAFIQKDIHDKFVGHVVIVCGIKDVEPVKAEERATAYCARCIDVLKLFSSCIHKPNRSVAFDLGSRLREIGREQKVLVITFADNNLEKIKNVSVGFHGQANKIYTEKIENQDLVDMNSQGFAYFHRFLIKINLESDPQELTLLVDQAISRFADALSLVDLHKRIVEIFTTMESLILRDQSVGILDKLKLYVPKLITKKTEVRKEVKKVISNMYNIRSKYVHHGKRDEIDLKELQQLQIYLRALIRVYIEQSDNAEVNSKFDILDQIDQAIEEAF